jgi:hypothetical protein
MVDPLTRSKKERTIYLKLDLKYACKLVRVQPIFPCWDNEMCCDVAVAQINYPSFKHNTQDSIE